MFWLVASGLWHGNCVTCDDNCGCSCGCATDMLCKQVNNASKCTRLTTTVRLFLSTAVLPEAKITPTVSTHDKHATCASSTPEPSGWDQEGIAGDTKCHCIRHCQQQLHTPTELRQPAASTPHKLMIPLHTMPLSVTLLKLSCSQVSGTHAEPPIQNCQPLPCPT